MQKSAATTQVELQPKHLFHAESSVCCTHITAQEQTSVLYVSDTQQIKQTQGPCSPSQPSKWHLRPGPSTHSQPGNAASTPNADFQETSANTAGDELKRGSTLLCVQWLSVQSVQTAQGRRPSTARMISLPRPFLKDAACKQPHTQRCNAGLINDQHNQRCKHVHMHSSTTADN
jgi:hypothetical protein